MSAIENGFFWGGRIHPNSKEIVDELMGIIEPFMKEGNPPRKEGDKSLIPEAPPHGTSREGG